MVKMPENLEINEIRRKLGEKLRIDRREVKGRGFLPERIKPSLDARHQRVLMMAEDQFEIFLQPGPGQVRRSREQPTLPAPENKCLGVQEVASIAANLDAAGAQKIEEIADRRVLLEIERQEVPVAPKPALELRKPLADAPPRELRLRRIVRCAPREQCLRRGIGAEEQTNAGNAPCLTRNQLQTLRIEVAARHAKLRRSLPLTPECCQVRHNRPRQRVSIAIVDEDGLNHSRGSSTNRARSRLSISKGFMHLMPRPMQASGILIFLVEVAATSCVTTVCPWASAWATR